jgi:hypothetical protein
MKVKHSRVMWKLRAANWLALQTPRDGISRRFFRLYRGRAGKI